MSTTRRILGMTPPQFIISVLLSLIVAMGILSWGLSGVYWVRHIEDEQDAVNKAAVNEALTNPRMATRFGKVTKAEVIDPGGTTVELNTARKEMRRSKKKAPPVDSGNATVRLYVTGEKAAGPVIITFEKLGDSWTPTSFTAKE